MGAYVPDDRARVGDTDLLVFLSRWENIFSSLERKTFPVGEKIRPCTGERKPKAYMLVEKMTIFAA